jgi:hypothetical protein
VRTALHFAPPHGCARLRYRLTPFVCVFVCVCVCLHTDELRTQGVPWTHRVVQRATPTVVMAVLASLLNVVCAYDPIGYGVPYVQCAAREARARLTHGVRMMCIQVQLPHVLRYQAGSRSSRRTGTPPNAHPSPVLAR